MQTLKCGDPVEITLANSSNQVSIEYGSFVGYDEDKAVVRLNNGKHKHVGMNLVQLRGKPYKTEHCPKCKNPGKWVDHGHAVGKGWYCAGCKTDIPSQYNTYGITGKTLVKPPEVKGKELVPDKVTPYFPKRRGFTQGIFNVTGQDLNCGKTTTCSSCMGIAMLMPVVVVKVADTLLCTNATGTKLVFGDLYKVQSIGLDYIGIDLNGTVKQFSRCRFRTI